MANGANRLFNVMLNTSKNTNIKPSQVVSLTVKSVQPLIFIQDDRLEIPEELCSFNKTVNPNNLAIGDIVTAMVFNDGQSYFIQQNDSANEILDLIYPIGSVYLSVNNTNPSTLFGGTWELIPNNLGESIYGNNLSSSYTNSWTNNSSIELPAGTYILIGNGSTTNLENGITLRLSSNIYADRQSFYSPDANLYSAQVISIITVTQPTTYYLQSWCAASGTFNSYDLTAYKLFGNTYGLYSWKRTA